MSDPEYLRQVAFFDHKYMVALLVEIRLVLERIASGIRRYVRKKPPVKEAPMLALPAPKQPTNFWRDDTNRFPKY